MNQKEMAKALMMILNLKKNPLASKVFIKKFSTLKVKFDHIQCTYNLQKMCDKYLIVDIHLENKQQHNKLLSQA